MSLAALTERVRRHVLRWFRLTRLLDAAAAADMLTWENSGFSVDASVRITLIDRDVPSYFQGLEHLLRYWARPPFALERLSMTRDASGRATKVRYVLPRHKAANWVGPGRSRTSTRPGANGVVELTPFEFLDRLADLVPPPRKHGHRYHGVFAPDGECRHGPPELVVASRGIASLADIPDAAILEIAEQILRKAILPRSASVDALHIAMVAHHHVDYLLTWNCTHIANARIRPKVFDVLDHAELARPIMCTPEELLNDDTEIS